MTPLHDPTTADAELERNIAGIGLCGKIVRFVRRHEGLAYRVKSVDRTGMLALDGMPGLNWSPNQFVAISEIQADAVCLLDQSGNAGYGVPGKWP